METEHKVLYEIISKIGFFYPNIDIEWDGFNKYFGKHIYTGGALNDKLEKVDVRYIIFKKEFIEKFEDYVKDKIAYQDFRLELMFHLDNPIQYLATLLDKKLCTKHSLKQI